MASRITRYMVLGALVVVSVACRSQSATSEPAAPASPEVGGEVRVLQVATSADYPPFAYYSEDLTLDGFDVALIGAVGREMGVEIDLHDIAFDGLYDALRIGQVDVAVAAISVTPERTAHVRFTDIYYTGEDAVLGPAGGGDETVTSVTDMAGRRVGVQDGSVYASAVQNELVEAGLSTESDIVVFADATHAIAALADGQLDYVWLDALPADAAVDQYDVSVVGRGLEQQQFAMAVRLEDQDLAGEINQALAALQDSGELTRLSEKYLGTEAAAIVPLDTVLSGTPVPTVERPPCEKGLAFVAHVNYDDHDLSQLPEMAPGETFVKSWRVKNTGTCPWEPGYTLRYAQGNVPAARMGGEPVVLEVAVQPGDEVEMGVELTAPIVPDQYVGYWNMTDEDEVPFGERLPAAIHVVAPPTPTPMPTNTPVPQHDIVFTADPTQIRAGQSTLFSWDARGAKATYFFPQGRPFSDYPVPPSGQRVASPNYTTTYVLRVIWPDGVVEERQIVIDVLPVEDAPYISWFSVVPEHRVPLGYCVDLRWDVQGNVTDVTLTANGALLLANAPIQGYVQHCPTALGTVRYAVAATGPGGTSRGEHDVDVYQPAQPLPTVTPLPPEPGDGLPEIQYFSVQPTQIQKGQCVAVSWELAGNVQSFRITRNSVVVQDGGPFANQVYDCLYSIGQITYRLDVWNSQNEHVYDQQIVVVR
jgi:ABC-type amino acid transport substrate-binding protein